MNYPKLSTFESRLFSYLSNLTSISSIATVDAAHPMIQADLGSKGRVTITHLNSLTPKMSRLEIDAAYQFACWDLTYAKARRLQEALVQAIESWQMQDSTELKIQMPFCERISGVDFSQKSQLYFASLVYRFPIFSVV